MKKTIKNPKVFISYAWGTQAFQMKVLAFATALKSDGIDVVIDKWSIEAGNDMNSFMEKSVSDPSITNVLILLDPVYVDKADGRQGGVGTETQIISQEVYKKVDQNTVEKDFTGFLLDIFKQLQATKNRSFPNVKLQKYGITKDCPLSNEAADTCLHDSDHELKFISTLSKTKRLRSEQAIKNRFQKHKLTTEIDKLGQKDGDNWIGVVHIDGNNMGVKFQQCEDLNQLRQLSATVKEITNQSFEVLLEELEKNIKETKELEKIIKNANEILPIRPIVIGGDDVTFVCNANLALYLTEKFITIWTKKMNSAKTQEHFKFSACGGIAYVKTKYPFYQSYKMAEDLCQRAKRLVKKNKDTEHSAIDFYIHQSSVSGEIDLLVDEKLHFGPYFVETMSEQENTIDELTEGIKHFEDWPRSKRKGLRDVLTISTTETKKYLFELNARGLNIPKNRKIFAEYETLNSEKTEKTAFMDIIEIMELYPKPILAWRCK